MKITHIYLKFDIAIDSVSHFEITLHDRISLKSVYKDFYFYVNLFEPIYLSNHYHWILRAWGFSNYWRSDGVDCIDDF